MTGLVAELKRALDQRADFSGVLTGSWTTLDAGALAHRSAVLERDGSVALGDLFDLRGTPDGTLRFIGNLSQADRLGAALAEGAVTVEGDVGAEAGLGMAGGILEIEGDAGPRAGAAPRGYKRGMTGGELVVHGQAGEEAGSLMRRGLLAIGGAAGRRAGLGMIAGTVVLCGRAGPEPGLWSKRGSVVALSSITPPATYVYACTYQPVHLKVTFTRLQQRFKLPLRRKHLTGQYRRYSGDMAELGRGEILAWTAS
jgi:formylmethanofuran dehydrogenase subunit C